MNQKFLKYMLCQDQRVLSIMGPSGTGKSFSAGFLQEFLDYKIAKQITTREPRPDDTHYVYMPKYEFIKLEQEGKILGLFAGDKKTLQGNGYGYIKEEILDQLSSDKKIILFSSAYELQQRDFQENYGTTDKVGLGFRDPKTVLSRALQCNKQLSESELQSRIQVASTLTHLMEKYNMVGDKTFNLIYSDAETQDLRRSKQLQLCKIVSAIGQDYKGYEQDVEEYISR